MSWKVLSSVVVERLPVTVDLWRKTAVSSRHRQPQLETHSLPVPVMCGYLPAICISAQCTQMNNGAQENQAINHFNVPHTTRGSVLTHIRSGGIFIDNFLANLMFALTAKDFWNLVSIWQTDGQKRRLFDSRQLMVQFCYPPASQHTWCIQYHTVL